MMTVLIDSYGAFNTEKMPKDLKVEKVTADTIKEFNNNETVIAVVGSRSLSQKTAELSLPNLKLFQLTSAGFDGVPLTVFKEKGVAVSNVGGIYSMPIAETVIFGILQIAKKIRNNPNNRHFKLTRGYNTITEIGGKSILVMGTGNIGTAVAKRLKGFECEIDGYDPYSSIKPEYNEIIRTKENLKNSLNKYDYIVSTMPDTSETKGFINKELFDCMKKSAVIINVGRKAVFNNNDFYIALKNKTIGGAVLDMFEKLPNPFTNKFRRLKNVVVLPGVAAISNEVKIRLAKTIENNILNVLEQKEVLNIINGVK